MGESIVAAGPRTEGHAGEEEEEEVGSCETGYRFCAASGLALIAITTAQTQEATRSRAGLQSRAAEGKLNVLHLFLSQLSSISVFACKSLNGNPK